LLPPPSAEFVLIVNPCLPASIRGKQRIAAGERFDLFINRIAFIALSLSEKNRIVSFVLEDENGKPGKISISPASGDPRGSILDTLASITLHEGDSFPQLIASSQSVNPETTRLLFTMPEQPCPVMTRTKSALLLLGPVLEPPTEVTAFSKLHALFFLASETARSEEIASYRTRFSEVLSYLSKGAMNVQSI